MTNEFDSLKAQIVDLSEYRASKAVRVGYRVWRACFKAEFDGRTRIMDLGPDVLRRLAEAGSDELFYSLIIGFLGFPENESFESLDRRVQMQVLDVHLFLADQFRFEIMRRLGWIVRFKAAEPSLFELVVQYERYRMECQAEPPLLAPDHPRYAEYEGLVDRDKQVFIRRLFGDALEAFGSVCG
jgi:hypothetical protein